jgi:hypothetical protein
MPHIMRAALKPQPVSVPRPALVDHSKTVRNIGRLIWLYIILLMFEGALRKWVAPRYSAPLLVVRDPVVVLIYLLALRARLFPFNSFVVSLGVIAILSWATGILVLLPYLPVQTIVLVTGYGFRSNFLHLPLIFIIPAVFDLKDVQRIGWWTIVGMIPMGILMATQFNASPESYINRAAGLGEGIQIEAGGGKIRPPGVFSFISGAVYYLSAAAAFLLHAVLAKLPYKTWLLGASGAGLMVGIGVSGSRSAVLAVGVVVASLALILVVRPSAVNKFGRHLLLAVIVLGVISYVPVFREGLGILSNRFTESAEAGETSVVKGLVSRTIEGFTEGVQVLNKVPIGGYGLGVGTNGGASFLIGRAEFLLSENEWSRILLESGPILGLAFLFWRCALTYRVGRFAFRQLTLGNTLPLFLFTAALFILLEGQFGQPTSLGFAVVLAGLCLAARPNEERIGIEPDDSRKDQVDEPPTRPMRRSAYAERLHGGPRVSSHPSNGSFDR